jgi:simple sugar transport system permease protein
MEKIMNKKDTSGSDNISNVKISKVLRRNEMVLILCIIAVCIVISLINVSFLSEDTLFETFKACVVTAIVAIGVGLVMINGGVDLSCMSIAIFSAYSATKIFVVLGWEGPVVLLFILAMAIGAVLGLLNALFIAYFKIPIFIATLCSGVIYKGFMLEYIGNIYVTPANMPDSTLEFSKASVFGGMHISVFIMVGLLLLTYVILKYTTIGRGVYALGGAPVSASRMGFNVKRLNIGIYSYAGVMYAIGGVVYVCNSRLADPYDMIGTELTVISAVVLGGVSITGGKGSVFGMFLGTLLAVLIKNNLILIGISSDWQIFVFGIVFILAIALQAFNQTRVQENRI